MKVLDTFLIFLICTIPVYGQVSPFGKVNLTSPEAAAIITYNNYPIDYASGAPNIEVPLFEIGTKVGRIPFKLSYHIGSIKPSTLSGNIGFGWSLSPNLGITRAVNGGIDGVNGTFQSNKHLEPGAAYDNAYLLAASENSLDEQPDDFYFSLLSKSGKFIYNNVGKFVTLPFEPIRIAQPDDQSFLITDDDGTTYRFGRYVANSRPPVLEHSTSAGNIQTTAWKITEIISFDKSDTIRFVYRNSPIMHSVPSYNLDIKVSKMVQDTPWKDPNVFPRMTKVYRAAVNLKMDGSGTAAGFGYRVMYPEADATPYGPSNPIIFDVMQDGFTSTGLNYWSVTEAFWNKDLGHEGYGQNYNTDIMTDQTSEEQQLSEVSFRDGYVIYNYDGKKIASITLFNRKGKAVKQFIFSQSFLKNLYAGEDPQLINDTYEHSSVPNQRYELDSLRISDGVKSIMYRFDYTKGANSIKTSFGTYSNFNTDFWGFYSGNRANLQPSMSFIAEDYQVPVLSYWGSGDPRPPQMMGTRGESVNLVIGSSQESIAPKGLPPGILSRITFPTGGSATFVFENNQYRSSADAERIVFGAGYRIKQITYRTGYGLDSLIKQYKYGMNEDGVGRLRYKLYPANFLSDIYVRTPISGGEGTMNLSTLEKIRTVNSKPFLGMSFSSGAPVLYPEVTEYSYSPLSQSYLGKTVNQYIIYDKADNWIPYTPLHVDYKNDWRDMRLSATNIFKSNNNIFVPIKRTTYEYAEFLRDTVNAAATFRAYYNNDISMGVPSGVTAFPRIVYKITSGAVRLTSTHDSIFESSSNVPLYQQQAFEYDSTTYFKKKEITYASDGRKRETIYRFVNNKNEIQNLTQKQSSVINQMIADNRLNNNLEISKFTDDKIQLTTRQEYDQYSNNQIYPSALLTSFWGMALDENVRIKNYDGSGNIVERVEKKNWFTSYKWGYNNTYPIVECKNAAVNEFYYEGYEESTAGGTINSSSLAHTGNSYTTSILVSWTKPNSKPYVISYWYKVGSAWNYSGELPYTANTYTMIGGDAYDDVRIYPKDAQMTTYTYDPLVGMTSQTNARGETTTYEYDEFQRLKTIRDSKGQIVKQMDYHYQNQ